MNLERKAKINPVLWSTLLDYAEINPEILTNKFYGISGKKRYDEKWEEVVEILNNMGYLHKPVDKWKKVCYKKCLLYEIFRKIIHFVFYIREKRQYYCFNLVLVCCRLEVKSKS